MCISELQFPLLTQEQVLALDADITEDDVREAVASMAAGKASGPDGLPLEV